MGVTPRSRLPLYAAFAFALAFTGYHVVRAVANAVYWHQHRDEPIEGWMTVGYVAHSYRVPPHVLQMALGLPPAPPDRRPLDHVAADQGRSEARLVACCGPRSSTPDRPTPLPRRRHRRSGGLGNDRRTRRASV